MSKLMIALIAGTFAVGAAAQTGIVNTSTVGDHGTQAMHAAETAKNVAISLRFAGLSNTAAKQQAVNEAVAVADHGTPVLHAAEARSNVLASKRDAPPFASEEAAREAERLAVAGQTK